VGMPPVAADKIPTMHHFQWEGSPGGRARNRMSWAMIVEVRSLF